MVFSEEIAVLRCIKNGDRNMVVQCISRSGGREAFFMRNIGRSAAGMLFPLSILECTIEKRGHGMGIIRNLEPSCKMPELRSNIMKYSMAQYMAELLYRTIHEGQPDEQLFNTIAGSAKLLNDLQENYSNLHIYFTLRLAEKLGYLPKDNWTEENSVFDMASACFRKQEAAEADCSRLSPRLSALLHEFLSRSAPECLNIRMNDTDRTALLESLIRFLSMHSMEEIHIKSIDVLREVFAY